MDWFLDLFGYDVTGDGLMTSGGSGSSVLAMLAARDALNITGHRIKRYKSLKNMKLNGLIIIARNHYCLL